MATAVEREPSLIATRATDGAGRDTEAVLETLAHAAADGRTWEVELGIGKGRYLVRRAASDPATRFLGVEMVAEYYRLASRRARRRRLVNLHLVQAEALYVAAALLPPAFASAVHVYFPDPWPKARHQKRRLFAPRNVDLLLRLIAPGGQLFFASDHAAYSEVVAEVLGSHPLLRVERLSGLWPDGARTNYEAKYVREGRPICRLVARLEPRRFGDDELVHPGAREALRVAYRALA